jgi:hypothetical protein
MSKVVPDGGRQTNGWCIPLSVLNDDMPFPNHVQPTLGGFPLKGKYHAWL